MFVFGTVYNPVTIENRGQETSSRVTQNGIRMQVVEVTADSPAHKPFSHQAEPVSGE